MEYTGFFDMRRCGPLPGYDGFIVVELSDRPVKYHIQPTFVSSMSAREAIRWRWLHVESPAIAPMPSEASLAWIICAER